MAAIPSATLRNLNDEPMLRCTVLLAPATQTVGHPAQPLMCITYLCRSRKKPRERRFELRNLLKLSYGISRVLSIHEAIIFRLPYFHETFTD